MGEFAIYGRDGSHDFHLSPTPNGARTEGDATPQLTSMYMDCKDWHL